MKGWRTIAIAAVVGAVGAAQQAGVLDLIPDNYRGLVVALIGAAFAGARMLTDTPVGQKTPPTP